MSYSAALKSPECKSSYAASKSGVKPEKTEVKTLGKVLTHLTSHIKDPKEPIDPRDFKQAKEVITAIKREKKTIKAKGLVVVPTNESVSGGMKVYPISADKALELWKVSPFA
jgi:uncharacterized OB-fold protein